MWQIFWVSSVVLFPLLAFSAGEAMARPQLQFPEGEVYVVQADDRLSKIAEKYYQDTTSSSFIVQATTAKAIEDPSFTPLPNPDLLEIGQKLWIPPHEGLASATPQPPSLSQVAEINLPA